MNKKALKNGRLSAFQILKKLGGVFQKNTALQRFREAKIRNPEGKFTYLLLNGNIIHEKDDTYNIR